MFHTSFFFDFTMPCPVCSCNIGYADHRMCLVELFRENKIKSVAEWEKMCSITCERCNRDCDDNDYAGCCNDGNCKFDRESLCYSCVIVEQGTPVCLDCVSARKPKTIRKGKILAYLPKTETTTQGK